MAIPSILLYITRIRSYSRLTREALNLLGAQIRAARRDRNWTAQELADRVGVTRQTLHKIEQGDPSVRLGDAFETATVLGLPLFDPDPGRRQLESARLRDHLAALPARVRRPQISDDF
jgi:transcriptional regulator with XRE-family HTH domain